MTEKDAITLAQTGDVEAFRHLYEIHHSPVFARCMQMLRSHEDAEDLAQDVFVHLFRVIGKFDAKSEFSTWLYRLTTNLVLMHLRHLRCRPPLANDVRSLRVEPDINRSDEALPYSFLREMPEPLTCQPEQFAHAQIAAALDKLSPDDRCCLELEIEGYGRKEIAKLSPRRKKGTATPQQIFAAQFA